MHRDSSILRSLFFTLPTTHQKSYFNILFFLRNLLGECLVAMIHNIQKCVSVFPDLFFNRRFSILFFIQLIFLKLY